jgi:hypothetical protein
MGIVTQPEKLSKSIHVYVDVRTEFDIPVPPGKTCGWLLQETVRRYRSLTAHPRRIVTLKSSDQQEGLDLFLL